MSSDVRSIIAQINGVHYDAKRMRDAYVANGDPLDCVQELVEDCEWLAEKYQDLGKRIDDELEALTPEEVNQENDDERCSKD